MWPTTKATTTHHPNPFECSAPADDTSTGIPETGFRTIYANAQPSNTRIALMHMRAGSAFQKIFARRVDSGAVTERAGSAAKDVPSDRYLMYADQLVAQQNAG